MDKIYEQDFTVKDLKKVAKEKMGAGVVVNLLCMLWGVKNDDDVIGHLDAFDDGGKLRVEFVSTYSVTGSIGKQIGRLFGK